MPDANRLTVGIMAMVAGVERRGGYREGVKPTRAAQQKGGEAMARIARKRATDIAPIISELQASGAISLRAIAAGLNERGIPTARGRSWSSTQVRRVIARNKG
jgi:hypothetical protein